VDLRALMEYFSSQKSPLNSQAEKERTRAMTLLRECLAVFCASDSKRNDSALRDLILETLIRKTEDIYQVLPLSEALVGCLAHFKEDACAPVTAALIHETFLAISAPKLHVPAYNQRVRFSVLKCYGNFYASRPKWLEVVGLAAFTEAVILATDGEKDPRNLVLAFDLLAKVIRAQNDELRAPELFDRIEAYFPIAFSPPKDDKFKVKPEDLKSKLHSCFAASPIILDQAVPFLLEKLTAPQMEAKLDCLDVFMQIF